MKRIVAILLAALLLSGACISCAEQAEYRMEEFTGRGKENYPYIVRTPFAVWHLSKSDMELLGEDAYCERLFSILDDMEADFADARAVLEGYISEDVPPIDIYTDFCNKAEASKIADAFYRTQGNYIKLFKGWDNACACLLHEYVHYLTIHCAELRIQHGFWAEGVADYVSMHACKNRLSRSVNLGRDLSAQPPEMLEMAWDKTENCLDPRLVWMGWAIFYGRGVGVGQTYFAVKNEMVERTEEVQNKLDPQDLTFYEASGIVAYLLDAYGKDTVFTNWDLDLDHMETVYGKTFPELYREWAAWNEEQCKLSGIIIP